MTGTGGDREPVDWALAARTGGRLAPPGPRLTAGERGTVVASLAAAARGAEQPVRDLTGLGTGLPIPEAEIVDRAGWIAAAGESMRALVGAPEGEPGRVGALLRPVTARAAGVQAGGVLAAVSTAILGQYDPFAPPDGRLLLVWPNIVGVERALGVRPADFRTWVCLHEVTHRVQFAAAPWLAEYMRDSVAALGAESAEPLQQMIGRLAGVLRRRRAGTAAMSEEGLVGLLTAVQGPAQRAAIEQMLLLGTLLEGHADHVMDAVGPAVVPSVARIRRAFDARRAQAPSLPQRLLRAALGMDVKSAQYVRGKAFVDAVVATVGTAEFNAVFTGPETLPRAEEIVDPQRWVRRVHG